jgi:hypothetical protein
LVVKPGDMKILESGSNDGLRRGTGNLDYDKSNQPIRYCGSDRNPTRYSVFR